MSLMFVALTLTNCTQSMNEENVAPSTKGGFSFTVNADTRASLEGNSVVWQTGDKVGLGGVIADNTYTTVRLYGFNYVSGNTFTNDTSTFTADNQFWAIWPFTLDSGYTEVYTDQYSEPEKVNVTKAYFDVGYSKTGIIQNGDNADHVPAVAPMYWMSEGLVSPESLAVQLHHTTALLDFTVVNGESEDITLNSLKFYAPSETKIAGTYYINLSNGELTPSGSNYVYSNATVTIENAPVLAAGESMHVYMPVAPFSVAAGETVQVIVAAGDNTCTIEKTFSSPMDFAAGTVNPTTINFVKDVVVNKTLTVAELLTEINNGTQAFTGISVHGFVSAVSPSYSDNLSQGTLVLTDNGVNSSYAGVRLFDKNLVALDGVTIGDELTISLANATVGEFGGVKQLSNIVGTGQTAEDVVSVDSYGNTINAKVVSIADYTSNFAEYDNVYMAFENVHPAAAGGKGNSSITFTDGTNELTVYNYSRWTAGSEITIADLTGTLYGLGSSYNGKAQVASTQVSDLAAFVDPCLLASNSVMFNANNGSAGTAPKAQVVGITVLSGYTVAVNASDSWINAQLVEGNTGVEISVAEYTESTEPRTGTVNVVVSKEGTTIITKTIEVTQNQVGNTQIESTVSLVMADLGYDNGVVPGTLEFKDGGTTIVSAVFAKNGGNNDPKYYTSGAAMRMYAKNNLTFTPQSGVTITKVVLNFADSSYVGNATANFNTGSYSVDGAVGTWTGEANSALVYTNEHTSTSGGTQARIVSIDVTYVK